MLDTNTKQHINNFVEVLKNFEEYNDFVIASEANENDPELKSLRKELGRLRKHFNENQNNGNMTQEEIQRLRSLQNHINSHHIVHNLVSSQNELIMILQECNESISREIGLDFAQNAVPSSCCG